MPEQELLATLAAVLAAYPKFALAFSGGLDSRFLAHAARLHGSDILLVNVRGPHISVRDMNWAAGWAEKRDFRLETFWLDPLTQPEVAKNSRERCYHCKKMLLGEIRARAFDAGYDVLCDGGNLDDQAQYRPGARAVKEFGVHSPLAEAGFGKAEIRACAAATGLDEPGQLSGACLLTRFAYGLEPEVESLARVEQCEKRIGDILLENFGRPCEFRLRLAPAPVVQVRESIGDLAQAIREVVEASGLGCPEVIEGKAVSGFFDKLKRD